MRFFTVINPLKGYHHVELDEESSAMTTFSTPFCSYISTIIFRLVFIAPMAWPTSSMIFQIARML
jgi:hypothetical protein